MSMDLFSLQGRDIWVFGGAGYLGSHTVELLYAAGASVLCVDLENRAEQLVANKGWSDRVTPASLNVSDEGALERFLQDQLNQRGSPSGLVVMTYKSTGKTLEDLTAAEFDDANHVGLTSTFVIARTVGSRMAEEKRGSIVLFSSMYGTISPDPATYESPMNPNPVEYGVGKAGIQQLSRYLSVHWGRSGVRCNSISPGPFPFPSMQEAHPDFIQRLASKTPLGRIGQAAEMAGPVTFLLSDASTYITGHNLAVDGGWTSW